MSEEGEFAGELGFLRYLWMGEVSFKEELFPNNPPTLSFLEEEVVGLGVELWVWVASGDVGLEADLMGVVGGSVVRKMVLNEGEGEEET